MNHFNLGREGKEKWTIFKSWPSFLSLYNRWRRNDNSWLTDNFSEEEDKCVLLEKHFFCLLQTSMWTVSYGLYFQLSDLSDICTANCSHDSSISTYNSNPCNWWTMCLLWKKYTGDLEEGFPQDRLVQTLWSGNYRPNCQMQVNRLPMRLVFRLSNIYTGDLCSARTINSSCQSVKTQTLLTYV